MNQSSWYLLLFAWIVALISTLGSLFFSDILGFPPCTMCWYQRICMYPLVIILLIGLIRQSKDCIFYVLPLAIIGAGWATYHNLLIFGIINENMTPCSFGVPCSVKYINWFGFIDIPFLALIGFIAIIIPSLIIYKKGK